MSPNSNFFLLLLEAKYGTYVPLLLLPHVCIYFDLHTLSSIFALMILLSFFCSEF